MKAKTTIDERILKTKGKLNYLIGKKNIIENHISQVQLKLSELVQKKARRQEKESKAAIEQWRDEGSPVNEIDQKDQAIGDKLVESGVITEKENQEIQKLPEGGN